MSDATEQRVCDEDFGSEEEGDVESYLEDNSGDLMDRLRELEVSIARLLRAPPETGGGIKSCFLLFQAENSALLLANESQREAYERCLDEVSSSAGGEGCSSALVTPVRSSLARLPITWSRLCSTKR